MSHPPLNCNFYNQWKNKKFEIVIERYRKDANLVDCPFCQKSSFKIMKITKKSYALDNFSFKKNCHVCQKSFCAICLNQLNNPSISFNQNFDHHCKENPLKGFHKKNAEEFFENFQIFNDKYPDFVKEKIHLEENLKKMKDYFEDYKFRNELEEEACIFFDSYIGLNSKKL